LLDFDTYANARTDRPLILFSMHVVPAISALRPGEGVNGGPGVYGDRNYRRACRRARAGATPAATCVPICPQAHSVCRSLLAPVIQALADTGASHSRRAQHVQPSAGRRRRHTARRASVDLIGQNIHCHALLRLLPDCGDSSHAGTKDNKTRRSDLGASKANGMSWACSPVSPASRPAVARDGQPGSAVFG
jgi:hypothetical protein